MAWANIELSPDLTEHPKMVRLASLLGSRSAAMGHLGLLWCWTSRYATTGRIDVDVSFLESSILDWRGENGRLIAALIDAGFIDRRKNRDGSDKLVVHNWKKRNAHIEAFRKLQSDKARSRWKEFRRNRKVDSRNGEMPGHKPGDMPNGDSGNASIYPSIPPSPTTPSTHPRNKPDDEGALARRIEIDLTGLNGLHLALFRRQPTKAQQREYIVALSEIGTERGRWEFAFSVGRKKEARTAEYIITTARNLEPKDWGAVTVKWDEAEREAAGRAAKNLADKMGMVS